MSSVISVTGLAPDLINFCPECGSDKFPQFKDSNGELECSECGLHCFIVEGTYSHWEE